MKYWFELEHEWVLKTLCWNNSHGTYQSVWFHSYEMASMGKSEGAECRLMISRGCSGEKWGDVIQIDLESVWWNISKCHPGDWCTTI